MDDSDAKAVLMDAARISELRTKLEADLERLQAHVAELEAAERASLSEASGENAYRDHMADQGSATFERELDMSLEENVRNALCDVRRALARFDDDQYGTCERCGCEIPVERLEAVPTATMCIRCKAAEEHR